MPPRLPTVPEWDVLSHEFPGLTQANVWITDEATWDYNCIAFSLGITDQWINPPQPLWAFQTLYGAHNHPTLPAEDAQAQIDGWARPEIGPIADMTHGSLVNSAAVPGVSESKLGSSFRITHGREELKGGVYGRTVTSFD